VSRLPVASRVTCIGNPEPRDVKVVVGTLQLGLPLRLGRHLGRRGNGEPMPSAPFRVMPRRARHALSGACRAGVRGVAGTGEACLGSADWPRCCPTPRRQPPLQLRTGFPESTLQQSRPTRRGLENRQRRKSLVGSNPTPSAFHFSGFVEGSALWRWLDTVPGNAWHRSPALTHRRPYCRGPEFLCPSGGPAGGSGLGPR